MQHDMNGKTALVTGAARGIGLTIAKAFAAAGAAVIMTDILTQAGEAAAQAINAEGGKAMFLKHDVREDADWTAVVEAAVRNFGRLDFLINNAGVETAALMTEFDLADLQHVFGINVFGVMLGTKHGLRAMRPGGAAGKGGAIVNIASAAAIMPGTGLSVYGASKAAVAHFTQSTAVESGAMGHGVRANCIMPGMTETNMATQLGHHFTALGLVPSEAEMRQAFTTRSPIGRYAAPSEIASVALFLCSDAASFMSGACLPVDGAVSLV